MLKVIKKYYKTRVIYNTLYIFQLSTDKLYNNKRARELCLFAIHAINNNEK